MAPTESEPKVRNRPGPPPVRRSKTKRDRLNEQLVECAFDGHHHEVSRLLVEGADIEAIARTGHTALSEACVAGHAVVVGVLIRAFANPNSQAPEDGRTPLHRAAFHGWDPVVRLLLDNGADPTLKDTGGQDCVALARNERTRGMLTSCTGEQREALVEGWRKNLASMAARNPDDDLDKPEEATVPATAVQPKPKSNEAAKARSAKLKAEAEAVAKEQKEREARFKAKWAELEADGIVEVDGGAGQGPPLTARVNIQGAGEKRLNGTYLVKTVYKERVEFEKLGDAKCHLSWAEYQDEWRMVIGDYKLSNTLYRHKQKPNVKVDKCHGVPEQGWQPWFGKDPSPTVRLLDEEEVVEEDVAQSEIGVELAQDPAGSLGAAQPAKREEFIELHSPLEIVDSTDSDQLTRSRAAPSSSKIDVRLDGSSSGPVLETADGLFGAGEVITQVSDGADAQQELAFSWLATSFGLRVEATWADVLKAKKDAQALYREDRIAEARQMTTSAISAIQRVSDIISAVPSVSDDSDDVPGADRLPCSEELTALKGVLCSNRALLLLTEIDSAHASDEVLAYGTEAAWRLVLADCDAALRVDAHNFKASYRRARALFEIGDLDSALRDATRVLEYYAESSQTSNPEAVALRERIMDAIRAERAKWGERPKTRWNKGTAEPLVAEVAGFDASADTETRNDRREQMDWARSIATFVPTPTSPSAAAAGAVKSLAATAPRPVAAPKTAGDVEKAIMTTFKGDSERQLAYVREHLGGTVMQKLFRRAPLGPDLLALLICLLGDLAAEDAPGVAALLSALAATPSARTHAAMFDASERKALDAAIVRAGGSPELVQAWAMDVEA